VLTGGRLTAEDAYAYAKFARIGLGTNDIDFRARPHSAEEADFLAAHVVGKALEVTYADLEKAGVVLLAGLEPEEESPILFLRLRKASTGRTKVVSIAPFTSRGLQKLGGTLIRTAPGEEPGALQALADDGEVALDAGGVILVGERLATVPGALSAAVALAATTGARLAWVPRRAGERGALEAGCLPNLLPGGRPVTDPAARVDLGTVWGSTVPHAAGRDGDAIVAAAAAGDLRALVVAGVDPVDLPDPAVALAAFEACGFLVSLEVRASAVSAHADVVLPVAPVAEKPGTFVDWEGRVRPFEKVLRDSNALPDLRVLAGIAEELGVDLGFKTVDQARIEMAELGAWDGDRLAMTPTPAAAREPRVGLRLATWKLLIDDGRMLDGEDELKATARTPVALVSAGTAAELGLVPGQMAVLTGTSGSAGLPVAVADLPDGVVWAPTTTQWSAPAGSEVRLTATHGGQA
jgi:NADH-quinone oxidoreductase subunit G